MTKSKKKESQKKSGKVRRHLSSFAAGTKKKMPERWQPHMTKRNGIIVFIIFFFLLQYWQVSRVTGGISSLSLKGSSLVDEVGQLTEMSQMFAEDLTEVRSFLLLPTRQYSSSTEKDEASNEENLNQDSLQIALFKYIGYLGEKEQKKAAFESNYSYLEALLWNESLGGYLEEKALSLSALSEGDDAYLMGISDADGQEILSFILDKESGNLEQKTINSVETIVAASSIEFAEGVVAFLQENLSGLLTTVKKIEASTAYIVASFANENVAVLLGKEGLVFAPTPVDSEGVLTFDIQNSAFEVVAQVVLNLDDFAITLHDARDEDNIILQVTDLEAALPPFIKKLDVLPAVQKKIIEAQLELSETFEDKGFKLLLDESGLYVETSSREDEYRYYYDIFYGSAEGSLLGSIVIQKNTGLVEVVGPDGADTVNLLFFEEGLKKKL